MVPPGPRPPALNCDAPRMGNPIGGMRSARPSGKTDKPLGEGVKPPRDAGRGSLCKVLTLAYIAYLL
jgi:hypothetical protein